MSSASPVAKKTLREMKLPVECVLIAILHKVELLLPCGDTILPANDRIAAVVQSHVQALADLLGPWA